MMKVHKENVPAAKDGYTNLSASVSYLFIPVILSSCCTLFSSARGRGLNSPHSRADEPAAGNRRARGCGLK